MPCTDGGVPHFNYEAAELRKRADRATRILCELIRHLEAKQPKLITSSAKEWYAEHKEADEARRMAILERREQEKEHIRDDIRKLERRLRKMEMRKR